MSSQFSKKKKGLYGANYRIYDGGGTYMELVFPIEEQFPCTT